MEFSLEGGEEEDRVENFMSLWYLGIPLDQMDDDWAAVRRKIMRARSIWGILEKLL